MYAPLFFKLKRYSETEKILKNIVDNTAMGMLQPRICVSLLVDKAEIESAKFYFELRASTGADKRRN